MLTENVMRYCVEEVHRQHDDAGHVWNMYQAWRYAYQVQQDSKQVFDIDAILMLGFLVKPSENSLYGFRKIRVGFDHLLGVSELQPPHPDDVFRLMEGLVDAIPEYHNAKGRRNVISGGYWLDGNTEWYRQFEKIHPFVDGNGRVGSILWNWLNDTLDNPSAPPDVFKENG